MNIKGNPQVCIVSAYSPTETADDQEKDVFYSDRNKLIDSVLTHTVTNIARDCNETSRIGKNNHKANPKVEGNHSYHTTTNNNGPRMSRMCAMASL